MSCLYCGGERCGGSGGGPSMCEGSGYAIGEAVVKTRGYAFPGVVVSSFLTTSGRQRYVVECTADGARGCLHIFRGQQLQRREAQS